MKKILLLIAILAGNVIIYATVYDEPEVQKEYKLCKGFKPKSYTHLNYDLSFEIVKCCAITQASSWCDFLAESSLCEEHLKYRITGLCITVIVEDGNNDEELDGGGVIDEQF